MSDRYRNRDDNDDTRSVRSRTRDEDRRSRDSDRDDDRGGRDRDRDRDDDRRGRDDDRGRSRSRDDDRGSSRGRDRDRPRFEYKERGSEAAGRRANQSANEFDKILKEGIKMFKPNDGPNRIRILPPTWEGADHYGHDIHVNYGIGPDRNSYLSLSKMLDKPDPIAEERALARQDGDEKYAKELEPKRRVLIYLIDRDHEKEGVQAWAMPWTLDRDISKVSIDRQTGEVLPIDHPDDGYDVEFDKKGQKDRTEYMGVSIARRSTPLGRDEWLDFAIDNPLPEQLNFFDYDYIAKVFRGGGEHRDAHADRDDDRRSRDRDDDRRGRDRDDDRGRSRDRDRDDDRGRGRDRDRDDDRGRGRDRDDDTPTWDQVHGMTPDELEDLIEQRELKIDPREAKDDEDLADWICEEMNIKKPEVSSRRRVVNDSDAGREESASDRLRRMREAGGR